MGQSSKADRQAVSGRDGGGVNAIEAVERLYRAGRFLDARDAFVRLSASTRAEPSAATLGRRLMRKLGAPALADAALLSAYRASPRDPRVVVEVAWHVLQARGPLATRDWLATRQISCDGETANELRELEVDVLVELRDFSAAERALARWVELGGDDAEQELCRSALFARADRHEDALACTTRALEAHPGHHRLTLQCAQLTASMRGGVAAIELLDRAMRDAQAASLAQMLLVLARGEGDHGRVLQACEALPRLLPLAPPERFAELPVIRAEALRIEGRREAALQALGASTDPAAETLRGLLVDAQADVRPVRLDVPFVLQEELGCVPATLTVLSRFFGRAADHVELAERICYAGTPAHAERAWAEGQGYVVREATLTWASATALVDRAIPFVLTTFVPGAGHAQAVIGYDRARRTLLLRDPSVPLVIEVEADELVRAQRHSGPRTMIMVPAERASDLEGVPLEDAALYDLLHETERALAAHDRPSAERAASRLAESAPGHRLARAARRALAAYDDDPATLLALAEEALSQDVDDDLARLDRLLGRAAVSPRNERLEALEEATQRDGASAVFFAMYAAELVSDRRESRRARRLARRALAMSHAAPRAFAALATAAWGDGDAARALDLTRFAACLDSTSDERAWAYFGASRRCRRESEALELLRDRAARLTPRSGGPALVLADALEDMGDGAAAVVTLERAAIERPGDGTIELARARRALAEGDVVTARARVEAARGRVDDSVFARAEAELIVAEGGSADDQLRAWERVSAASPLAVDAAANVSLLLRRTRGVEAALAHVRAVCARFPHHRPLARLHLSMLRDAPFEQRVAALRGFIRVEPRDAWAHRELALALSDADKRDDASAASEAAADIAPAAIETHLTRAAVAERRGDTSSARASYQHALAIDPEHAMAVARFVDLTPPAERPSLLHAAFEHLERVSVTGAGLEALYDVAAQSTPAWWLDRVVATLRERRPELPAVWRMSIRHAIAWSSPEVAMAIASDAAARFPFSAEIGLDAAEACSVGGDRAKTVEHLRRVVELDPTLLEATFRLASLMEADGLREATDALLARAYRRTKMDSAVALTMMRIRANRGDTVGAFADVAELLRREPELDAAWQLLSSIADTSPALAVAAVEAGSGVGAANLESASIQASLAFMLLDLGRPQEAHVVLQHAAERGLRSDDLRDATAVALVRLGYAPLALQTLATEGEPSPALALRRAWVYAAGGNLGGAIEELRRLLDRERAFVPGWDYLVDCALDAQWVDLANHAARQLVALAPLSGSAQLKLARALHAAGDRAGTKSALARVLERDASPSVARDLFAMAAEERDVPLATRAAAVVQAKTSAALRASIDVRLELLRGAVDAALDRFAGACRDPAADEGDLGEAYAALELAGAAGPADAIVSAAVAEPGASAAVGAVWVRCGVREGRAFGTRLLERDARSAAGRRAAEVLFDVYATSPDKDGTSALISTLRHWLCSDDVTWAAPLRALVAQKRYVRAMVWGRAWRVHREAPSDAFELLVVANAAWSLRARAHELALHGVAQATGDGGGSLRAWLAFDAAVRGRVENAAAELAIVDRSPLSEVARCLAVMTRALLAVETTPRSQRKAALQSRRADIAEALAIASNTPSLRDAGRRCNRRLARLMRDPLRLVDGWSGRNAGLVTIATVMCIRGLPQEHAVEILAALAALALLFFALRGGARFVLHRV